jgi:preprotein translocase subunit SecE
MSAFRRRENMARLQRKKSGTKKKKKLQAEGAENVSGSAAAVKGGVEIAKAKSGPRKSSPAQRRVPATRPAPGKLRRAFDTSVQFLREVKVELKKVTWPSRKQTMGSTAVVIVLVVIISFFLGIVDIGLSSLIRVVLQ